MSEYKCKIRFLLPGGSAIGIDKSVATLALANQVTPWRLRPRDAAKISDSRDLFLIGGPFRTRAEALKQGRRALFTLRVCGVKLNLGIDLGKNRPRGGVIAKAALRRASRLAGRSVVNDIHGLMIIKSPGPTEFLSVESHTVSSRSGQAFEQEFSALFAKLNKPTPKQELALELYAASYFEASPRAQLLTLVTAIETLTSARKRSKAAQALIQTFIDATESSQLSDAERKSLLGGLGILNYKPLSATAGAVLDKHLPGRVYEGMAASRFFRAAYKQRSTLIHRGTTDQDMTSMVSTCRSLVGDVLVQVVGG